MTLRPRAQPEPREPRGPREPSVPRQCQPQPRRAQRPRPGMRRGATRRIACGQAMVEYLVACTVAIAILAIPVDGSNSGVELLLKAIQTAYQRFLSAIALPM